MPPRRRTKATAKTTRSTARSTAKSSTAKTTTSKTAKSTVTKTASAKNTKPSSRGARSTTSKSTTATKAKKQTNVTVVLATAAETASVPDTDVVMADPAPTTVSGKRKRVPSPAVPSKAVKTNKGTRKRAVAKPIYDEIWKEVYLAGTEWDQLKMVYDVDWEFDHLDEMLNDGDLVDKNVHLFGATEPQLLMRDENDKKGHVIPVPVIVAVVCDVPPPATVGIKSVQRSEEEIIPMSNLRMGWHAYAPENVALNRRFKPKVHVLKCNERRARLRNMSEADAHKYDYVLPYFIKPDQVDTGDENTNVQVLADLEGRAAPLMLEFDYEMDDFKEFVTETLEENDLDAEKHTEPLKNAIREAVKATKLKYKAEREARQKMVDAIPKEDREAIKKMKLLKFYPENEWPDVSKIKSKFINRYYGHATEIC